MSEFEQRAEAAGSMPVAYEPSELVKWLKKKAHEASAVEGIQKDWLCTAALVMALEHQIAALERTNALLQRLLDKNTP